MMSSSDQTVDIFFRDFSQVCNLPDIASAKESYLSAEPYPHLIIKDFFSKDIADAIAANLRQEGNYDKLFTDDFQKGKTISTGKAVPQVLQAVAARMCEPQMLTWFEETTKLKNLVPDPYYNSIYGYYHIVNPGGVLGSHVDHSHHMKLGIPHVLNIVVYLTPDWKEEDGGSLCLFDSEGKKVVKKIPCEFNTAAVFACNPHAFHGVEPVKEGANKRRHSIYFAYYTTMQSGLDMSQTKEVNPHVNLDKNHGTYFVVPFWSLFKSQNRYHLKYRIRSIIEPLLPPIFVNMLKKALK